MMIIMDMDIMETNGTKEDGALLMPEPVQTQNDIQMKAYPVLVRVVSLVNSVN